MLLAIIGSLAGVVAFVVLVLGMSFLPFDNPFVKVIIGSVSSAAAFWVAISISTFPLHWAASTFITMNIVAGATKSKNLFLGGAAVLTAGMILVRMYA